jgi:hypothetical protein
MHDSIVLSAAAAQKPWHGGHTWALLQYVFGLRRLGLDVLLLDQLPSECFVDDRGRPCPPTESVHLRRFVSLMAALGLADSFSVLSEDGVVLAGRLRDEVMTTVSRSLCLLNVMGFLTDEEVLGTAPLRVFLDIDPGFTQLWRELGLADLPAGHDAFVTVGGNIGREGCGIPTCGLEWRVIPPPVVLDEWPVRNGDSRFTTVASWRGAYGPLEYGGKTYGLRVHEFRKFVTVPRYSEHPFEIALDIHPDETNDLALLKRHGWRRVDPREAAGDPWAYRAYVQNSMAEFGVAKNMYVETRSGWFSDRSVCYLASGKPVVVQDTGLADLYPLGEGLVTFTTADEAIDGIERVSADYRRHARAARDLAEAYFDSGRVLSGLLSAVGVV